MKTLLITMALIAPLAPRAWAGADSSGGGNGIVCFDDASIAAKIHKDGGNLSNKYISHVVSVEAYDLYVAKKRYGADALIPLGDEKAPLMAYGSWVNKQLYPIVPQFSWAVEESAAKLPKAQIINQPFGLIKVDDVEPDAEYDKEKCVLATMATHYHDEESYFLHLDRRLFDHPSHSKWSREVLLLHEFVYMYARRLGHTSSKNTRDVIAMMLRQKSGLTPVQWIDFLFSKGFGLEGERYLGYPGAIAYNGVIQMLNVAVHADEDWWGLVEGPQITAANQALAEFGKSCGTTRMAGCLRAIYELEDAKAAGAEKLAQLKATLTKGLQNKLDQTSQKLADYYFQSIKPKFDSMPYGPEKSRTELPPAAFERAIDWVLGIIEAYGTVRTGDKQRQKMFYDNARAFGRQIDSKFDLNVDPYTEPM